MSRQLKIIILVGLVLLAVLIFFYHKELGTRLVSSSFLVYWQGDNYQERIEKTNISFKNREVIYTLEQEADINGDGQPERAIVKNNIVYLYQGNKIIWQSNPQWQVENVILADVNNDQKVDVVISLWKFGKYGPDLPFWLEENINDWGNHLFIYQWQNQGVELFWGSSTLDAPIREMKVVDINNDQQNELIVLEGDYNESRDQLARYVTIWQWNEWSFFNRFRSQAGRYFNLRVNDWQALKSIAVNKIE